MQLLDQLKESIKSAKQWLGNKEVSFFLLPDGKLEPWITERDPSRPYPDWVRILRVPAGADPEQVEETLESLEPEMIRILYLQKELYPPPIPDLPDLAWKFKQKTEGYLWGKWQEIRQKWLEGKTASETVLEILDPERVSKPQALDFVQNCFEEFEEWESWRLRA